MEEIKMLEILNKIKDYIPKDSLDVLQDIVKLEIDNLKEITKHHCRNKRYYFESYCRSCTNLECKSNPRNRLYS